MNVAWVQAVTAIGSVAIAVVAFFLARRQTQAGRLSAIRDIVRDHHSGQMRELRKLVRSDLVKWLDEGKPTDASNEEWAKLKSAYEDILNYYEYLGSLLKEKLIAEDIVLRIAHNSAVEIWKIHERYGDRIRPAETRAKDFAGEYRYLVERARAYRLSHGLEPDAASA